MKARYSDTFLQLQCSEVETGKLQIQGHIIRLGSKNKREGKEERVGGKRERRIY